MQGRALSFGASCVLCNRVNAFEGGGGSALLGKKEDREEDTDEGVAPLVGSAAEPGLPGPCCKGAQGSLALAAPPAAQPSSEEEAPAASCELPSPPPPLLLHFPKACASGEGWRRGRLGSQSALGDWEEGLHCSIASPCLPRLASLVLPAALALAQVSKGGHPTGNVRPSGLHALAARRRRGRK
jgi:hypothetical protein